MKELRLVRRRPSWRGSSNGSSLDHDLERGLQDDRRVWLRSQCQEGVSQRRVAPVSLGVDDVRVEVAVADDRLMARERRLDETAHLAQPLECDQVSYGLFAGMILDVPQDRQEVPVPGHGHDDLCAHARRMQATGQMPCVRGLPAAIGPAKAD